MTVVTYKNYGEHDAKLYDVIIYDNDGGILWHGITKSVTLKGSAEPSAIKGGKGEPRVCHVGEICDS